MLCPSRKQYIRYYSLVYVLPSEYYLHILKNRKIHLSKKIRYISFIFVCELDRLTLNKPISFAIEVLLYFSWTKTYFMFLVCVVIDANVVTRSPTTTRIVDAFFALSLSSTIQWAAVNTCWVSNIEPPQKWPFPDAWRRDTLKENRLVYAFCILYITFMH